VLSSTWVPVPSPDKPFAITVTDATGNITTLADVTIAPQFATYLHPEEQYAPARLNQLTRRLTAAVGLAIAILLALAILIRIRIQHPWLITHAAFVLVLATALLLL
jgi:hypothetical protein